ncbi:MAG: OPT/YSL family transporter, partial [Leptospiraceae bacterium]|nr:OPT/YSL family transporter [Leptospiraceae bacterium]
AAPLEGSEMRDIPGPAILGLLAVTLVLAAGLFLHWGWGSIPMLAWILILSVPVVAVATYLVGLVGSSNSPVSGITLSVLLLTGLLLLPFMDGSEGILALLLVAGLICCAASTAGDIAQDLKTGHLVGANPAHQQWAEILGIAIAAPIFASILQLLHHSYGIGSGHLKAPQATLFASIASALFGDQPLPVSMILLGAGLGAILFVWNRMGRYRIPIMPVAVGMYLPLSVSAPLLMGGILHWAAKRWRNGSVATSAGGIGRFFQDPLLYSSGLIAGEALAGIALAIWILIFGASAATDLQWPAFLLFLLVLAPLSPIILRKRQS